MILMGVRCLLWYAVGSSHQYLSLAEEMIQQITAEFVSLVMLVV